MKNLRFRAFIPVADVSGYCFFADKPILTCKFQLKNHPGLISRLETNSFIINFVFPFGNV